MYCYQLDYLKLSVHHIHVPHAYKITVFAVRINFFFLVCNFRSLFSEEI